MRRLRERLPRVAARRHGSRRTGRFVAHRFCRGGHASNAATQQRQRTPPLVRRNYAGQPHAYQCMCELR